MLPLLTLAIMGMIAYAYLREGVFTAFVMCVNVFLAGLVSFNFWEPIADALEPAFADGFLAGYEDFLALIVLFCLTLSLLRWVTNSLASAQVELPAMVYQGGAVLFSLLMGYLVSGFIVCALQTLPWHESFLGYQGPYDPNEPSHGLRQVLPPDRIWLAMMHRASVKCLNQGQVRLEKGEAFDRNGSFSLRYGRYRRYNETREALPYDGLCPP